MQSHEVLPRSRVIDWKESNRLNTHHQRACRGDESWVQDSLAIACVVTLLAPFSAFAYTDPGTGTMLWQMLLAGLVGVSFYARRIVGWFTRNRKR